MSPHNVDPTVGGCSRCESLPARLPESGTLYLAPPMIHTTHTIRGHFESMQLSYSEPYEGIFAARFKAGELGRLCKEFLSNVSPLELRDSKALILEDGDELKIHHLTQMQPLQGIVAQVQSEWLFGMLAENRIHTHFHPIVHADDPTSVYAYECLARAETADGQRIPPNTIFEIARQTDLLFNLDRVCRLAAIDGCVRHGIKKTIFVNFNPATIYKPEHCLQTTMHAIKKAGLAPKNVVFEVVESEEIYDVDHLLGIMDYYREHGFRVALDDLGAGYSSLNLLTRLQPDFIKLDMDLVRDVDTNKYKSVITENLLRMAHRLGVSTIAEGVETIGEWKWLAAHGAEYLQGFLFARPAAPPETVVLPE